MIIKIIVFVILIALVILLEFAQREVKLNSKYFRTAYVYNQLIMLLTAFEQFFPWLFWAKAVVGFCAFITGLMWAEKFINGNEE